MMKADVAALVGRAPDLGKPGCYILRIRLSQGRKLRVGRLGAFSFSPGEYVYAGSARAGLARRLARHFRAGKRLRWHIDYLLRVANIEGIWYVLREGRVECEVARLLEGGSEAGPKGFGSSDCRCHSHLFRLLGGARWLRGQVEKGGEWHYLECRGLAVGDSAFNKKGG